MKKLYVMIGCPASGKSTWVKNKQKEQGGIIVSRDEIRFNLVTEEQEYFSKEKEVFQEYVRRIQEELDKSPDAIVYADATHIYANSRDKLLRNLNLENTEVYAVMPRASLQTVMFRNSVRAGRARVPSKTVRRMYYSIEDPKKDKWKYKKIIQCDTEEENGNLANI